LFITYLYLPGKKLIYKTTFGSLMKELVHRILLSMAGGVLLLGADSCNAQVTGCTDPLANNYDPSATENDGSCTYDPFSLSPRKTHALDGTVKETSGLVLWDELVWTHNDNTDTRLYGLNGSNGNIAKEIELLDVENRDWEEISQDENYLYIGDIGNNSGNRTDLHILRIEKSSLSAGQPVIDTIWFAYQDQEDFDPGGGQQTDFDCEAFVVAQDKIYLFTKQWLSVGTSVYTIPKIPGDYQAEKVNTYNIQGLVTGATYMEKEHLLVLSGYTSLLYPFFHLCYDFRGEDFFSGNNRRITVALPFHQMEGITSENGLDYYATNERTDLFTLTLTPQRLHLFDMRELLDDYLLTLGNQEEAARDQVRLWPSPAGDFVTVEVQNGLFPIRFEILDDSARVVMKGRLKVENTRLDISQLPAGGYTFRFVKIELEGKRFIKH
jgi:hypothetical protein